MKKNICPYCGNNPVNHRLSKLADGMDSFFAPTYKVMSRLNNSPLNTMVNVIIRYGAFPFRVWGLWKFQTDPMLARTDRSKVIWLEAQKREIEMQAVSVFGKTIEQHRARINRKWHYFESLPIPPQYNHTSFTWIDDKDKLRKLFKKHHIPISGGGKASTFDDAKKIFKKGTPPFIVKPQIGSRGRHVTTHIYSIKELKHAFEIAKQLCFSVIVEEQLVGSVYRGTYVNGEVVGVLRGDPPRIIGDGRHTIHWLIKKKNKKKHEHVADVLITNSLNSFLTRQRLTLQSIPKKGNTIDLSEKIGISYGGHSAEEFSKTHPKILKYLKKAGDLLGCPVVGFDFIIQNITKDPDTQRWGIIEANSLPFIDLHHYPLEGKPINVAAKIWDLW